MGPAGGLLDAASVVEVMEACVAIGLQGLARHRSARSHEYLVEQLGYLSGVAAERGAAEAHAAS
jgi:hypothetical protein